jgi:hypothetical protein
MALHRGRRSFPLLGAVATASLHALLLTPVLWGGGAPAAPRLPERMGASANAGSPSGAATERLILIDLSTQVADQAQPRIESNLVILTTPPSMIRVLGPDSRPLKPLVADSLGEASETTQADLIARTQLAGLYEGQIRARIERLWLRPRTALADPQFHCRVKIRQDASGTVRAVTLQDCEGTQDWLDSMIRAVKASSPLPAPPDPAVFADTLEMSFHAFTFTEGSSEEGFEPLRALILASSQQAGSASQAIDLKRSEPSSTEH